MDLSFARGVIAALGLALFIGIVLWAWSHASLSRFDEAARLPFNEQD